MTDKGNDIETQAINCKVVLIGKSGVGKTSIISRYTKKGFKDSLMATPDANSITKKVDFPDEKETIKFEIWDTAGQERLSSLDKVYDKNVSVCILVYDITNKVSFEDIKNYWVPELKEKGPPNISM